MTDKQAKEKLQQLLKHYTIGRILGLLGELYFSSAEQAFEDKDLIAAHEFVAVSRTLDIVGTGLDAKYPY